MASNIRQISLVFFTIFPVFVYGSDTRYSNCSASFSCGNFSGIGYPFRRKNQPEYCGHPGFELDCQGDSATIHIESQKYQIIEINPEFEVLKIARTDFMLNICPETFEVITLDFNLFNYTERDDFATLFYDCDPAEFKAGNNFLCPINNRPRDAYFFLPPVPNPINEIMARWCKISLLIPVLKVCAFQLAIYLMTIDEVIKQGFEVKLSIEQDRCGDCRSSGGKCGYNKTVNDFTCFCPDQAYSWTCPNITAAAIPHPGYGSTSTLKLGIGLGAAITSVAITCLIIVSIFKWKKISLILSMAGYRKIPKSEQDLETFIRNCGPLALNRYSFSNVKKITNSFKHELGQGGYGSVYKGKLSDGCIVAVKLLKTTKGNGQEFINEVASISRTSHVNVVTLLGFCLEGSNRALIYEFMPNGSLDKFINNGSDNSKPNRQHLGWDKIYQVFIGIARGLEYLHRGCNMRILHFDIKPHNILDEDFCPKISDFGMAKFCLQKESIVSILEPRGTIGYIAPEVFSRSFGEVSHKSDVYSYGMMILELVGFKNKHNSGADHSSEIYFPHWIYKHFERDYDFKVPGIVSSEENEIANRMIIVGLWCIQSRPSDRPSMNRVIKMLQNSTEALKLPPKPFVSSPPRPPIDCSTISTP